MNFYIPSTYKRTLAVSGFVLAAAFANGQYVKDLKRTADENYAKGNYYSAAVYYEQYLTGAEKGKGEAAQPYTIQKKGTAHAEGNATNETNEQIVYRIAESYRAINDYGNAEKWYAQAIKFDKAQYPDAAYYYAVSLRANAKYAEAQQQLESFISTNKQAATTELAKRELADVKFIQEQLKRQDATLYSVGKMNTQRTGDAADYAAVKVGSSVYFTSTRPDSALLNNKKKSPFVNALYQMADGAAQKVNISSNNMEQGVAALTPDGNRLFVTRWANVKGENVAAIYTSTKTNHGWSEPVKLNTYAEDNFSSQQPFVTSDGKYLLFSSNRNGGSGKFDLYYAPLQANGEIGKPVNFGRSINTKDDDQAPFYHQASNTLVFASKGRVGMGGYDLYQSKGSIGSNWGTVENLGYPVNSNKDDLYFFTAGNKLLQDASISSDRSSACCLELFAVNRTYKKYIAATVKECASNEPLAGASAQLSVPAKLVSSANGQFVFEVNDFAAGELTASKANFNNASAPINVPSTDMDTLFTSICLTAIEVVEPPVVTPAPTPKVALFDFARYELRPETKVVLDTLGALLLREPMLGIEIIGYTDKKGTDGYNVKLSELRALECKNYLLAKGVPEDRMKVSALGECCPVKVETTKDGKDDPAARQANRRVEFKVFLR